MPFALALARQEERSRCPIPWPRYAGSRQQTHADRTAVLNCVRPFGKYVAPPCYKLTVDGDKLSCLGGNTLAHEPLDALQRKRFDLREVLPLAGHGIETGVKALSTRFSDGNDCHAHGHTVQASGPPARDVHEKLPLPGGSVQTQVRFMRSSFRAIAKVRRNSSPRPTCCDSFHSNVPYCFDEPHPFLQR